MDIRITATNVLLKPITKERINKKFTNLSSKMSDAKSAVIDVREEGTKSIDDRFLVKCELDLGIKKVRTEERGRTVLAAIDKSMDVLTAQVKKVTAKKISRQHASQAVRNVTPLTELPPTKAQIKAKAKTIMPAVLTDSEALQESDKNSLPFFLFIDKNTKSLKIVDEVNKEIYIVKIPKN